MDYTNLHPGPYYDTHTKVLDHQAELRDIDAPYGAFKSAAIKIEGPLRKALCKRGTFKGEQGIVLADDVEESIDMGIPTLDAPNSDFPEHEARWPVHLLEFSSRQLNDKYPDYIVGLVLKLEQSTGTKQRFSRLGLFHFHASFLYGREDRIAQRQRMEVFRDCQKQIIELV